MTDQEMTDHAAAWRLFGELRAAIAGRDQAWLTAHRQRIVDLLELGLPAERVLQGRPPAGRGEEEGMTGEQLRAERLALQLTQEELAAAFTTTANTVARWERGERAVPYTGMMRLALEALWERKVKAVSIAYWQVIHGEGDPA